MRISPGRCGHACSACDTRGIGAEPNPGWNAPTPRHEHGHVGGDALPPARPRGRSDPDGTLAAVINLGGFLGFGSRPVSVPVDALVLVGQVVEVDAFTPKQLKQLPTFSPGIAVSLSPDTVIKVGLAKPSH
jgi:hypothetical protein